MSTAELVDCFQNELNFSSFVFRHALASEVYMHSCLCNSIPSLLRLLAYSSPTKEVDIINLYRWRTGWHLQLSAGTEGAASHVDDATVLKSLKFERSVEEFHYIWKEIRRSLGKTSIFLMWYQARSIENGYGRWTDTAVRRWTDQPSRSNTRDDRSGTQRMGP